LNNNLNKNNISNYENKYINTQQTIINESDYNEEITPNKKNLFLYPRNNENNKSISSTITIKNTKQFNSGKICLSQGFNGKELTNTFF
jgi:hypothetical protein